MKYTVIGAQRSGVAAAILAKNKGNEVFLTELREKENCEEYYQKLAENNIKCEFGKNSFSALDDCDCVITSPGVPPNAPIIQEAEKRKIKIISEIEFARTFCTENPLIAITGTNGKTTTTTLTAYILNRAGKKAITVGNIGRPLSAVVDDLEKDTIIVAELSSYQLDRIENFRPDVAMILNITPDHLTYHQTMENYVEAKCKIFSNMSHNNLLILGTDDAATSVCSLQFGGHTAWFTMEKHFSMDKPLQQGIYNQDGVMKIRFSADPNSEEVLEEEIMLFDDIRLPGVHNAYNSMAAAIAARAFEVSNEDIRDALVAFEGVDHRLEFVRTVDGVDFINDSKATNINSTWYALSSYQKPIVWIAGGHADSNDYTQLDKVANKHVKSIIAIGEEADNIFNHFCTTKRCIKADSMCEAVALAKLEATDLNVVVFTPACKSFDMFMNFEHRGEVYKECVNNL
jgi:UDP-N-acetylmuramoylalanine--D-glutamate ligase